MRSTFEGVVRGIPLGCSCTRCSLWVLQVLAVVNDIPNHRNQQQILRAVTSSGCLSGLPQLAKLPEYERARLLIILDLVCTCCIGHNTDVQVLAHGLVPLSVLLHLILQFPAFVMLWEQATLFRCLAEIWWVAVGPEERVQELHWWIHTDFWWHPWLNLLQAVQDQIEHFLELEAEEQSAARFGHFLDSVVPCLNRFFQLCVQTPKLQAMLEEHASATRDLVAGLIYIANACPCPPQQSVEEVKAFWVCLGHGDVGVCGVKGCCGFQG